MTRDELIAFAFDNGAWGNEGELHHMLDILEPVIRTDERELIKNAVDQLDTYVREYDERECVVLDDVLDLLLEGR